MKPTRPDGAPGYKVKPNRDGTWREGWEARHDLVKRGYRPSWVRLYYPDTPDGRRLLAARCQDLQGQMLAWAANEGAFPKAGYEGTIASLARHYFSDEFSPYRGMKWNSQIHHDKCGKIIVASVGPRQIGKLLGLISYVGSRTGRHQPGKGSHPVPGERSTAWTPYVE